MDLNRTRSSTLHRWPRPRCTEGDNKCRSNANQTASAAVASSDFDVHAPIAPVLCVLCPCVLFPRQIVKPEPEFSEDGKACRREGCRGVVGRESEDKPARQAWSRNGRKAMPSLCLRRSSVLALLDDRPRRQVQLQMQHADATALGCSSCICHRDLILAHRTTSFQ